MQVLDKLGWLPRNVIVSEFSSASAHAFGHVHIYMIMIMYTDS